MTYRNRITEWMHTHRVRSWYLTPLELDDYWLEWCDR